MGRRMNAGAANLVDHVLPEGVPLRQWVLTLPYPLHYLPAFRPDLPSRAQAHPSGYRSHRGVAPTVKHRFASVFCGSWKSVASSLSPPHPAMRR